jgi:hypothetical protein
MLTLTLHDYTCTLYLNALRVAKYALYAHSLHKGEQHHMDLKHANAWHATRFTLNSLHSLQTQGLTSLSSPGLRWQDIGLSKRFPYKLMSFSTKTDAFLNKAWCISKRLLYKLQDTCFVHKGQQHHIELKHAQGHTTRMAIGRFLWRPSLGRARLKKKRLQGWAIRSTVIGVRLYKY